MKNVRETILKSSKKLLLKNGYSKTTIREIIKDSGVLSGSIYHFFDNKEDIFKSLILEMFDEAESLVISRFGAVKSTEFLFILMTAVELKAVERNDRIRDLYYEAYSSDVIFEKIADQEAKKCRQIFDKYNSNYALSDYYNINLMIKGAMRSCIVDEKLAKRSDDEKNSRNKAFYKMILTLVNMPAEERDKILKEIEMMQVEIEHIADEIIIKILPFKE